MRSKQSEYFLIQQQILLNIPCMRYRVILNIVTLVALSLLLGACPTADTLRSKIDPKYFIWQTPTTVVSNIWQTMATQFKLCNYKLEPAVIKEIRFYMRNPNFVYQLTQNATPYISYIYQQTQQLGIPAELALLPMVESNYDPFGISRQGATGLWQMMPGTASGLGIKINWWYDGRRNIIDSTKAALHYLTYLHSHFHNWLYAIAAYDSGEGTVQTAIEYNLRHHRPINFWSLPLPKETRNYVPKLLALAAIIRNPKHYRIKIYPVPNSPYFKTINMNRQMALMNIAKLSDTNINLIIALNSEFRRWATAPDDPYILLLPLDKMRLFQYRLKNSKFNYITWAHHRVKRGDSLSRIAFHYHTTISLLKRINHLKSTKLYIGQNLLISKSFQGKYLQHLIKHRATITEDRIPGPKRIIHTVTHHDTLSRIAARYHVKSTEVRFWNNLAYRSKLKLGQKLIIWQPKHLRHAIQAHVNCKQ